MKRFATTAALTALLSIGAAAQDARTVLANASKAMGADNLTSITYSGAASDVNFLQTQDINGPWPPRPITNYVRAIDFSAPASRATGVTNNVGIFGGAPTQGNYNQNITAANAAWAQQLEIYITPWGFLKGAAANNATVRSQRVDGRQYQVVSWMTPQKAPSGQAYRVNGYINAQNNMVDRVETWLQHETLGDMHVNTTFADYKDFGGVKVPGQIVQNRGGYPFFTVTVASAAANPANLAELLTPPQQAKGKGGAPKGGDAKGKGGAPPAAAAKPAVESEKIADGVYRITGGYVSMAIEYPDYIMVLEGGQAEARGLAVIAEAKRLIPNKPIRYVMNTHPHSDHTAGLAPFVAEGATIITHENNKKYLEAALGAPRTLVGDTLAKNPKKPRFETVGERKTIQDGGRVVEFRHVTNLGHNNGMLIAYLPKEKVVFQADFTLPAAGAQANPFVITLAENVARWNLDFERFVPVHAPNPDVPWTKADLMRAAGR